MISTKDLEFLPDVKNLKQLTQSLAMLEAIIEPDWSMRYYSFNAQWGTDEEMASMRDGSGNGYFILFNSAGAILKGFDHESVMSPYESTPPRVWPGVLEGVPEAFSEFLTEPAFTMSDTTFCLWRTHSGVSWQRGDIEFPDAEDADGSAGMLAILDGNPPTYQEWAEGYYERPIDLAAVTHIYEHRPLTQEIIKLLNSEISFSDIAADAEEIGY